MSGDLYWIKWPDDIEDAPGVAIEIECHVPKLDQRGRVRYGAPVDRWWIEVMPVADHWEFAAFLLDENGDERMEGHNNAATRQEAQEAALAYVRDQEEEWQAEVDDILKHGMEP